MAINVVKVAKNIALAPARLVDGVVLHAAADGSKYVLKNGAPWAWNSIPAGFKTAVAHHVLDQGSKARQTLDALVTVAGALAIADKVAGPDVAIYREIFEFYANNRLFAAGLTVGVPSLAVAVYDRVKHGVPNLGKNVYRAGMVTATGLLIAMSFIGHPVGIRGVTEDGGKPAAVEQKPLTQQDLEAYVTSTLLPQIREEISKGQLTQEQLNEVVTKSINDYVTNVLTPGLTKTIGEVSAKQKEDLQRTAQAYVLVELLRGGYVTASDLAKINEGLKGLEGQVGDLASKLQQPQLTPTAIPPTAIPPTAIPPTTTPTPAPAKPGQLEKYLQSAGYVVPADTLKAAAKANLTGLAAALSLPAETLAVFTDGSDANGEFVYLVVASSGVTARANYGASTGQRDTPQPKTNQLALSVYLQNNLTPAQLNAITPVK